MDDGKKKDGLSGIVDLLWLTKENASFNEEEGFLSMVADGKTYDRVLLSR